MLPLAQPIFSTKSIKRAPLMFSLFAACLVSAESVTPVDGTALTVEDVQLNLLGSSITVTDVSYLGENGQIGLFEGYEFLFGESFKEGVVLSTGLVESVIAVENTDDESSTEFSDNNVNDDDLGDTIYDPAKLSIKFYPSFSSIKLDFIFGSEEYNEYVATEYNDRLEILVNGVNCALTPDNKPFSINTVNDRAMYPPLFGTAGESSNPELYINNDPGLSKKKNGGTESPSVDVWPTEMDGFTKLIQCTAEVTPHEENTLIIGIVDLGDAKLDSWAFFRADSLVSTPSVEDGGLVDSDNDGIPDSIEAPDGNLIDSDDDGIADYLDLDSDNDGIPDSVEYQGNASADQDLDGYVDNTSDPVLNLSPVDTDSDGIPDYLDLDSDNDSLSDLLESLPADIAVSDVDANGDGVLDDVTDTDNDGLIDVVDPLVSGGVAGEPLALVDIDSDGLINSRDVDSDGDSFDDAMENGDFDKDGTNDRLQLPTGIKTAVSGIGSFGFEIIFALPLLLGFRRLRTRG
jgi:hypothetical protein